MRRDSIGVFGQTGSEVEAIFLTGGFVQKRRESKLKYFDMDVSVPNKF